MIIREYYLTREDGVRLYHTYSDQHYKIRQIDTDIIYDDAIDVEDTPHVYIETDELIEEPENGEQNNA